MIIHKFRNFVEPELSVGVMGYSSIIYHHAINVVVRIAKFRIEPGKSFTLINESLVNLLVGFTHSNFVEFVQTLQIILFPPRFHIITAVNCILKQPSTEQEWKP